MTRVLLKQLLFLRSLRFGKNIPYTFKVSKGRLRIRIAVQLCTIKLRIMKLIQISAAIFALPRSEQ